MGKNAPGPESVAARKAKDLARAERHSVESRDPNKPLDLGGKPGTPGIGQERWATKKGKRQKYVAKFPDGRVEEHWLAVPPKNRRCRAKIRSGPYEGQRCRKLALRGAKVCLSHGGQLPMVKLAAEKRLLAASDLAVKGLINMAFDKKGVEDANRIRAMLAILDRAGLDGKQSVTIEVKPWQEALRAIGDGLSGKSKRKKNKGD